MYNFVRFIKDLLFISSLSTEFITNGFDMSNETKLNGLDDGH